MVGCILETSILLYFCFNIEKKNQLTLESLFSHFS